MRTVNICSGLLLRIVFHMLTGWESTAWIECEQLDSSITSLILAHLNTGTWKHKKCNTHQKVCNT